MNDKNFKKCVLKVFNFVKKFSSLFLNVNKKNMFTI